MAEAPESLPYAARWNPSEVASRERSAVGFYLSSHPLDAHTSTIDGMGIKPISEHGGAMPGEQLRLAGMVVKSQARQSRKGNRFCIFRLEDQTRDVKCLAWADAFAKHGELLKEDALLVVEGRVESNDGSDLVVIVNDIFSLTELIYKNAQKLIIDIPANATSDAILEGVFSLLGSGSGPCEVYIDLGLDQGIKVRLAATPFRISGSGRLEQKLSDIGCGVRWEF